jgi:hypothetical protein
MSGEFTIRTDHRSLVHLDDQRLTTPWQQKAMTKLLGLQYKICYKNDMKIELQMCYPDYPRQKCWLFLK